MPFKRAKAGKRAKDSLKQLSQVGPKERRWAVLAGLISVVGTIWALEQLADWVVRLANGQQLSGDLLVPAVLATLLAAGGQVLRMWISYRSATKLEVELGRALTGGSLATNDLGRQDEEEREGATLNLLTDGLERYTLYRQTFLPQIFSALAIPLLVVLWVLVRYDWLSGLILALAIPLIPLLVGGFLKVMRKVSSASRKERNNLAGAYLDAIKGMETLQYLAASARVAQQLAERGERNRQAIMRLLAGNQLVLFVVDLSFSLFMVAGATGLAIWRYSGGHLSATHAVALVFLSIFLLEPMDQVGAFFYVAMGGIAAGRGLNRFWLQAEDGATLQHGTAGAQALRQLSQGQQPSIGPSVTSNARETRETAGAASASISGHQVSFAYPQSGPVLNKLDFSVPPKSRIAVVGPSGAGKSTFLKLLSGQLSPSEGEISLQSQSASAFALSQASAPVAQTTWLFATTIRQNLLLVAPQASEAELWSALEKVQLADEVKAFPSGLDTEIGEQGMGLSGGQAQRLSLARALLSGREILLLDEPTSAVDLVAEEQIRDVLAGISDRTMVMVTHRAGLLPGVDQVWEVVDHGLNPLPHNEDESPLLPSSYYSERSTKEGK
ncbi:hypothetical protein BK816_01990 [Boudabousia tangfeifanii]|uniref:ABC transporter ATP-binding protein n=1 Tax=Boudabousia tangfeifanii TaxID=1912795 RepID=A0A1D9MIT9_9ACTO|nr:ATP-binding cassette domain-containing protein [Boudabousia tangfeifanii]AOZ72214.1 hypothetical protein BK816_01990 [Boudabousia tangfeifanii]